MARSKERQGGTRIRGKEGKGMKAVRRAGKKLQKKGKKCLHML